MDIFIGKLPVHFCSGLTRQMGALLLLALDGAGHSACLALQARSCSAWPGVCTEYRVTRGSHSKPPVWAAR